LNAAKKGSKGAKFTNKEVSLDLSESSEEEKTKPESNEKL
jgi:hypothetical protein